MGIISTMKTTSNIVAIQNGLVLLVFKKDVWILPGGKHENDESDEECLLRECSEELPTSFVKIGPRVGTFQGTTPHSKQQVEARVFFGTITTITGNIEVGAEIDKCGWFTKVELNDIPVSSLTATILDSITFCTEALPQTMVDRLGQEEDRAHWIFCGAFPLKDIAAGKRAARHTWRQGDLDFAMIATISDKDPNEPRLLSEFEYDLDISGVAPPFNLINDMLAEDWYLEHGK